MTHAHKNQPGFTLVELSLSMTFIAMLLLSISLLIIQISTVYNKGITLREVNQQGQLISSDIQRTLAQGNPITVDGAFGLDESSIYGDRLCVGTTVYAWNLDTALNNTADTINKLDGSPNVRLVRFTAEDNRNYCDKNIVTNSFEELPPRDQVQELLSEGDRNLALHRFILEKLPDTSPLTTNNQNLYKISFVLGTPSSGMIETAGNQRCIPAESKEDDYCAVNEFVFTARTSNME